MKPKISLDHLYVLSGSNLAGIPRSRSMWDLLPRDDPGIADYGRFFFKNLKYLSLLFHFKKNTI